MSLVYGLNAVRGDVLEHATTIIIAIKFINIGFYNILLLL
jgi:hypothetical protein